MTEPTGYRYYKPYETERFLRWFGTNYIPVIDPDTVTKKTICSSPNLSSDIQSNSFYADATNIMEGNLTDTSNSSIDSSTTISLLSMVPKATIDVIQKPEGQFARMVVSGHMNT